MLSNIQVFDLSRLYPGPLCGQLLSDLGAQVIKIEDESNGGDPTRYYPPILINNNNNPADPVGSNPNNNNNGNGLIYHCFNRGKHAIALNFKKKESINMLKRLILFSSDGDHDKNQKGLKSSAGGVKVLLDSSRPGKLENLLGIEKIDELLDENLRLVVCRISAFGQDIGRYSDIPAHDMNAVGSSGIFDLGGDVSEKNDKLKPLPIQLSDVLTGYSSALQITAMIRQIETVIHSTTKSKEEQDKILKGMNRVIDVSMFDNAISAIQMPLSMSLNGFDRMASEGRGVLCGSILGYNIYPTKSGQLAVACLEPHFWLGFINALADCDKEKQANNWKHYTEPKYLFSNDSKLKQQIIKILQQKTADEWEQFFAFSLKLPITKIRKLKEVDQQLLQQRNMLTSNKLVKNALDYKLLRNDSNQQNNEGGNAPSLGEHNNLYLSKL